MTKVQSETTKELIEDFQLVPCVFPRDALFTLLVVESQAHSLFLELNRKGLSRESIAQNSDRVLATYFYASELAIFNFANSDYISKHSVQEYFVVISEDQVHWANVMTPDFDFVMLNQIMHTFAK